MNAGLVSRALKSLPPLTDEWRDHLARLATLPDDSIDTSDIPELSDAAWRAGRSGSHRH